MPTTRLTMVLLTFSMCLLALPSPGIAQDKDHSDKVARGKGDIVPPPPCHPNPNAAFDIATVLARGDIRHLPNALTDRLAILAGRPHTYLPLQAFAEADKPSQLFQYYLLDTNGFEPNPFTSQIPGVNAKAMLTATGADCGLRTLGAVRLVLENPSPTCRQIPTIPTPL